MQKSYSVSVSRVETSPREDYATRVSVAAVCVSTGVANECSVTQRQTGLGLAPHSLQVCVVKCGATSATVLPACSAIVNKMFLVIPTAPSVAFFAILDLARKRGLKSSTAIRPNAVTTFRAHLKALSLRWRAIRRWIFATARLAFFRLFEPCVARDNLRCVHFNASALFLV